MCFIGDTVRARPSGQLSCSSYYWYFLLKQEHKCCPFAVLTYVHCSVGFKILFWPLKLFPLLLISVGKIGGHNFTRTKAKTLFVDTTCDIPLTEYENRFLPFHLAVLFLAWNSIWLKIKSCSFQLHIMLPAQLTPSPVYPGLQVQVKERLVLVQYASSWQLCCPVLHSSTNQQVKVS